MKTKKPYQNGVKFVVALLSLYALAGWSRNTLASGTENSGASSASDSRKDDQRDDDQEKRREERREKKRTKKKNVSSGSGTESAEPDSKQTE
ncbi:MAG: hypothetical protein AB7F43_07110 [Bacteriovoracia bacterium]